jgi:hypothetical protein
MDLRSVLLLASPLWLADVAAAQSACSGQPGLRALLPRDREIPLARSAAPPSVSEAADVWTLGADGYSLAVEGTSGAACFVSRDWVESLEPVCYDPEGSATIMRVSMRRVELLHRGWAVADVDREIARAIGAGELRLPRRVAVSYMQSAAQRLVSDDGRSVGAWRPHLMLYQPYLSAADLGFSDGAAPNSLMLVDGGTPTAMMMIIVPDFVEPRTAPPPE